MKRFICIAAILLSFSACGPRAEIEGLKKDVKSLKEADAALWEEMTAAIDALEKSLMGRIQATKDKLGKTIDEALADLYDLIDEKFGATEKYFESELAAKRADIDKNAAQVKNSSDNAIEKLDIALDYTREQLQEAISKGEQERAALLEKLESEIESMSGQVEDAWVTVDSWKERLDELQDDGLYGQIEKLEKDFKVLQSFDLQENVDMAEERLKKYSSIVLDDLTEDQIKEVDEMLGMIEDYYSEVESFVDDAADMADEMESLLSEWQSSADDLYGTVSSLADELTDRLESFSAMIESSYEEAVEKDGEVEDWKNHLESINEDLENFKSMAEAISDDMEGNHSDLEAKNADIHDTQAYLYDMASDLLEICEQFESSHYWLF